MKTMAVIELALGSNKRMEKLLAVTNELHTVAMGRSATNPSDSVERLTLIEAQAMLTITTALLEIHMCASTTAMLLAEMRDLLVAQSDKR